MRASRSPKLLLLLALTLAAGGCAEQPAPWWAAAQSMVSPPQRAIAVAPPAPGIDTMVYGSMAPPAPRPATVRVAVASENRGLFTSGGTLDFAETAPTPPASGVVMTAVAPTPKPAPVRVAAASQNRGLFTRPGGFDFAETAPTPPASGVVMPPVAPAPMPHESAGAAPEQPTGSIVTTAAAPPPSSVPPPPAPQYAPDFAEPVAFAPAPPDTPYTLDSGDRLRVVVFGQDGLSNSYLVDASGHIDVPLIGSVVARGATTEQLASRIADKLKDGYVKEPHVAVEVEAYRPFFILGEVAQPGQYPYVAYMTVETAVAIAGGFGPRAYRRTVTVSRVVNGQRVRTIVPITYVLRPGDTVNVGERWF